jgi:Zn-dependent peptidase ImmA (M78 family)/DNA-binding XRE family transcriptional regulator
MTALQLAELIGVTKAAVCMFEKSKCRPSEDTFSRIVQVLRLPAQHFLRPAPPAPDGPIFYRSMASATQRMRTRAERKMEWVREIVCYLDEFIDLPAVNIPDISPPADPAKITDEAVEDAAAMMRRHWELGEGPIGNVALVMENAGVVASRFELEAKKLDAFSLWDGVTGRPLLILGSDKETAVRSRFDAAHELGHLLLHRNVPKPLLDHPQTFSRIEAQAHHFAGAFLLPPRTFARDFTLATLNALKALKPKWKASIGLMIKRAEALGLVSATQGQRLWVNRSRQGWTTHEPYDDELEPERPVLLARSIQLLIESNTASRDDVAAGVAKFPEDIEALACLPAGYLSQQPEVPTGPEPRLLRFSRSNTG